MTDKQIEASLRSLGQELGLSAKVKNRQQVELVEFMKAHPMTGPGLVGLVSNMGLPQILALVLAGLLMVGVVAKIAGNKSTNGGNSDQPSANNVLGEESEAGDVTGNQVARDEELDGEEVESSQGGEDRVEVERDKTRIEFESQGRGDDKVHYKGGKVK